MKHKIFLAIFLSFIILISSCDQNNNENEIHIPFSLENDRIVLEAVVNGQKGRFVFDSGSVYSHLGVSARNLFPAGYRKEDYKGKEKTVIVYSLNKIRFGDTVVKARSWFINRSDLITLVKDYEGYDGILGIRTFEGYWCELSFSKQKIILYKEKPIAYGKYAPLKMLPNSVLYLPITIDNTEFYMNIDTGSYRAILFPNDIILYKNKNECREIVSNERVKQYYLVKTNSISILDEIYTDMSIMTNSYIEQTNNLNTISHNDRGIIGINFLKYYDLLFDYTELRKGKTAGMYYRPIVSLQERNYGFFSFIKEAPEHGILNFYVSDNGLIIISLLKDSVAYNVYGLRPGTIITKINEKPINEFTQEELAEPQFYHTVDNFTILDNGREKLISH